MVMEQREYFKLIDFPPNLRHRFLQTVINRGVCKRSRRRPRRCDSNRICDRFVRVFVPRRSFDAIMSDAASGMPTWSNFVPSLKTSIPPDFHIWNEMEPITRDPNPIGTKIPGTN
jgi:hypothetical protein